MYHLIDTAPLEAATWARAASLFRGAVEAKALAVPALRLGLARAIEEAAEFAPAKQERCAAQLAALVQGLSDNIGQLSLPPHLADDEFVQAVTGSTR